MDVYASDEEKVEALRKWWKENWKAVSFGLLIGLGGLYGWRYWQATLARQADAASETYQQMLHLIEEKKNDDAAQMGKTLMAQSPGSIYAALAALTAARLSVEEENYGRAKELLAWVSNNSEQPEVKRTARLRLARIHLAENDAAQAWTLLADMDKSGDLATVQELKGDVQAAQNKFAEARKYYEVALARVGTGGGGGDTQTLQAKLNDLGTATAAAPAVK